ncbi:MAG: phenylalanine--tRNA ligase subunit alpha [Candidatus Spechtbacteria bacterium SB0662_bin_43]|uniref:Phenylalanine--tRNA ligase alpha subunit n=1 Tax=Candidatus Spechtbacteria bacterium SB0662_bin_43 TaxID=2604897 RepID=A0A845DCA1_9BACT|nr:phenylalanine--tRNA ligase subunit alpha [Candidatus Spechtbacteria bacterium SB0662_bin_43]
MDNELEQIKTQAISEIQGSTTYHELDTVFRSYLGRKGRVTLQLRALSGMPIEERKTRGSLLNGLKENIEKAAQEKRSALETNKNKEEGAAWIDITRPGTPLQKGSVHPLTRVGWEIEDIFVAMGFDVSDGPHVETEYYNFEALNIPANHPARDLWDTFWLKPKNAGYVLRTHTSPMQIRYMEKHQPPLRLIVPGRVFRYEATDQSHHFQFNQVEGLMVGTDVSVAHFRAVIGEFFEKFFGTRVETRLRPGFFPFVEPGFEVDMRRQGTGWLEMAGAGMVHPNVLKVVGYDPQKVSGFAFGMGWDRLAMMKYHIDDVRLFQEGDIRFLKQFV